MKSSYVTHNAMLKYIKNDLTKETPKAIKFLANGSPLLSSHYSICIELSWNWKGPNDRYEIDFSYTKAMQGRYCRSDWGDHLSINLSPAQIQKVCEVYLTA